MKKMMKNMVLVAAAAMGIVACQKEIQEEVPVNGETVQVTFVAGTADTKTSVDASGEAPVFAWGENETFAVLEQQNSSTPTEAGSVEYEKVDGKAKITATFGAGSYVKGAIMYQYATIYPASGYVGAESLAAATLSLPAEQTMATGSYDPAADLMVSTILKKTEPPTEAQMVSFTRMAAVVKMTLKNFTLEAGDEVEQVIFTAEGKSLAGKVSTNLSDPHKFTVVEGAGVDNVTVNTTSSTDVYFTVLPTTLEAGDAYTVTILTNKKLYIKQGTIPADKTLAFEKGMVTRFGVNMEGIAPSDKWVLVRDASTLKEGDVVAIVAKDYDKALSTKLYSNASETSTSAKRGLADITKIDNYLIGGEDLQQLTLVTGTVDGTFSFYDEARGKFLVSNTTGSTYLINQIYCDVNTSFKITIDGETTAATITNTEGAYAGNLLRYNSNGYFTSNQNSSTVYKDVCVYRLEGAVGTIPVIDATVTVPDSDEPVVIAEEGAAEATAISEVVFNYVGDWTIAVASSESWFSPIYADGKLSYTAEANTGAKREATVTITATLEGQESLSWTFNVLQKGAPEEITIAEFMTKGQDVNVAYKITGRITEMTSSSSGTFKLTDGTNVATVTYLYTDAGDKVYGDTSIGLEVGDVVTVTTVVASTTKGKGGSSAYHSIYKGHYGLKASAGVAAEYTGGSVAIEVTTKNNGSIVIPEAVTAVMTENDFAELSYNGGDQATVTFASENTSSEAREAEVTFSYGMTSVVVTVQQGINPANKTGYELVTDASTLAVGDEVIIVAKNSDKALACPTKTSDTKFPSTDIEKTGNVIYDIEKAGVQTFVLESGSVDGTMAFKFVYKDETYYPYYSSGLKMRTSINEQASWTISIDSEGDASISTVSSSKTYLMKFNSAPASLTFTTYLSTATNATKAENAVAIYKKQVK